MDLIRKVDQSDPPQRAMFKIEPFFCLGQHLVVQDGLGIGLANQRQNRQGQSAARLNDWHRLFIHNGKGCAQIRVTAHDFP